MALVLLRLLACALRIGAGISLGLNPLSISMAGSGPAAVIVTCGTVTFVGPAEGSVWEDLGG